MHNLVSVCLSICLSICLPTYLYTCLAGLLCASLLNLPPGLQLLCQQLHNLVCPGMLALKWTKAGLPRSCCWSAALRSDRSELCGMPVLLVCTHPLTIGNTRQPARKWYRADSTTPSTYLDAAWVCASCDAKLCQSCEVSSVLAISKH